VPPDGSGTSLSAAALPPPPAGLLGELASAGHRFVALLP